MKVLIINGSPRKEGNTCVALNEMKKVFNEKDVEVIEYNVGIKDIRGCAACNYCHVEHHNKCVFNDDVNKINEIIKDVNGVVIASPVYYASPNGTLISLLDRLFYSCPHDLKMKVGCSVVIARRAGTSTSFDVLNKYFTMSEMPIVSSTYWNQVFGRKVGEANEDKEGLCTMRNLANNMIFLMKSIELGKKELGIPETEVGIYTNFIK